MKYIICPICLEKFKTLKNNLKIHNLKAPEFKKLYPNSPISSPSYLSRMRRALAKSQPIRNFLGTKHAICIECNEDIEIGKFLSVKKAICNLCKAMRKPPTKEEWSKCPGYIDLDRYTKDGYVDHLKACEELNKSSDVVKRWARRLGLKWVRYNTRTDVNSYKITKLIYEKKASVVKTAEILMCSVRTVLRRISFLDLALKKSQLKGCYVPVHTHILKKRLQDTFETKVDHELRWAL